MEQETIQKKKPSLFGMIFSPGIQFERIREKPVIWIPLILFTVIMTIVSAISVLNVDYSAVSGMEMSPEELEMAKTFGIAGAAVVGFFVTPITYLIFALIFWGIAKIAKTDATYKQMLSFTIFTSFITIIGQILNQLIILAIDGDPAIMLTSVNSFVGADGVLGAVLSTIEVFTIWYYILLTMGLVIVGKLSKPVATIITIVFFVLGLIFAALGGAIEGMTQF
jgi:Yip1 domain